MLFKRYFHVLDKPLKKQTIGLSFMLGEIENEHYQTTVLDSLPSLEKNIRKGACQMVILDLDSLPVDNRLIRNLRKRDPSVRIIVLSSRRFHPELEEAMSTHIYACLSKPVDSEELIFWLRTAFKNETGSRNSQGL